MEIKTSKKTTTKKKMYPEPKCRNVSSFIRKMPVGLKTGPKSSIGKKPKGYKEEETDCEEMSDMEE